MKLTIIWSWTCVPSLERSSQSNLVEIWDKKILVDCWPWTLRQLEKSWNSYKDIDIIAISHYHNDHIWELSWILQALSRTPWYDRKKTLTLLWPLWFKDYCKNSLNLKTRENTFEIQIQEISNKINNILYSIESYKTIHCKESIAYKFTENWKNLVITWDTDYDEWLIKFSENVDLLVIECSFTNEDKVPWHLSSWECWKIWKNANVEKMILNHIYPTSTPEQRLKEAKEYFKNTEIAEDLKIYEI